MWNTVSFFLVIFLIHLISDPLDPVFSGFLFFESYFSWFLVSWILFLLVSCSLDPVFRGFLFYQSCFSWFLVSWILFLLAFFLWGFFPGFFSLNRFSLSFVLWILFLLVFLFVISLGFLFFETCFFLVSCSLNPVYSGFLFNLNPVFFWFLVLWILFILVSCSLNPVSLGFLLFISFSPGFLFFKSCVSWFLVIHFFFS